MKETAQSHMLKHLLAVLGVTIPGLADWDWEEETPHTRNQEGEKPLTGAETAKIERETKRAAAGVASALSRDLPQTPRRPGIPPAPLHAGKEQGEQGDGNSRQQRPT